MFSISHPITALLLKVSTCWAEALLWVSTKFDDPNDGTSWAATALAEHYHNSPTSWAFPDYLDLTSQRENDFKDWTSCLSFSKIQQLETRGSPSLFLTCTTMSANELSPVESPGGRGSSTLSRAGLCPLADLLYTAGRGRLRIPPPAWSCPPHLVVSTWTS